MMCRLVGLSSATSTRAGGIAGTAGGRRARLATGSAASDGGAGTQKRKVLPSPGTLSTVISPPISSTSWREIARPRPVPPRRRVAAESTWVKRWKSCRLAASGMPTPVSRTATRSRPPSAGSKPRLASTLPASVNLTALPTRLISTCRSRAASQTSDRRHLRRRPSP